MRQLLRDSPGGVLAGVTLLVMGIVIGSVYVFVDPNTAMDWVVIGVVVMLLAVMLGSSIDAGLRR